MEFGSEVVTVRKKRWKMIAAAILAAISVAVVYWWMEAPPPELHLQPGDPVLVAQGAQIYMRECASCHGRNLEGQPDWRTRRSDGLLPAPPHDGTGHTWHHPDGLLIRLTKEGPAAIVNGDYQSAMPGYGGVLSDSEIVAVLSFIKSTWPDEIRQRHDLINRRQDQ